MSQVNPIIESSNERGIVRKIAKTIIKFMYDMGAEKIAIGINSSVRWLSYQTHRLQLLFHYAKPHETEWFDHYIDVNYTWGKTESSYPWERGILNALTIRPGAKVLELCSGDGFNARFFYAEKAISVLGIDINSLAVSHAKKHHISDKITFLEGNILTDIPDDTYDNVIWDASLYMFSDKELLEVVELSGERLVENGVFSGHSSYDFDPKNPHQPKSIIEFETMLKSVFKNVKININTTKDRLNAHFYASNGKLPFDLEWKETFL